MRAIIILLLLAAAAASAQTRVYQWTDEDGVVHFSTEPPPDPKQAVEARMVDETPKPGSVAPVAPAKPEPVAAGGASSEPAPDPREVARQRAQRCEEWKRIVATIEPAQRIEKTAPDGTVSYLSGEDRIAELERARQMVAENCN